MLNMNKNGFFFVITKKTSGRMMKAWATIPTITVTINVTINAQLNKDCLQILYLDKFICNQKYDANRRVPAKI